MNNLISYQDKYPTILTSLEKLNCIFNSIHSFKDIERIFLKGKGLNPNTYRSYHTSVETLMKHYIHDEEPASPYLKKLLVGVAL